MTLSREWGEGDRTALLGVSGLDTVTHWSSGADRHQAPGWRLPAESRPQGRRSPVWHSPAGGLESEAQPGPWRALRHTGCPRPGPPRETPLAPVFPDCKAGRLCHHLLHPPGPALTDPGHLPLQAPSLHVGTAPGPGHLQIPVAKAEAGQPRGAVKPQPVVEGGGRGVRVSTPEGAQHSAHWRGLRDLSPGSRGRRESGGGKPWLASQWPR